MNADQPASDRSADQPASDRTDTRARTRSESAPRLWRRTASDIQFWIVLIVLIGGLILLRWVA